MLDGDDLDFISALAIWWNRWALLVMFAVAVIVAIVVSRNQAECDQKTCDAGEPVLIEGECRCLDRAH